MLAKVSRSRTRWRAEQVTAERALLAGVLDADEGSVKVQGQADEVGLLGESALFGEGAAFRAGISNADVELSDAGGLGGLFQVFVQPATYPLPALLGLNDHVKISLVGVKAAARGPIKSQQLSLLVLSHHQAENPLPVPFVIFLESRF